MIEPRLLKYWHNLILLLHWWWDINSFLAIFFVCFIKRKQIIKKIQLNVFNQVKGTIITNMLSNFCVEKQPLDAEHELSFREKVYFLSIGETMLKRFAKKNFIIIICANLIYEHCKKKSSLRRNLTHEHIYNRKNVVCTSQTCQILVFINRIDVFANVKNVACEKWWECLEQEIFYWLCNN